MVLLAKQKGFSLETIDFNRDISKSGYFVGSQIDTLPQRIQEKSFRSQPI